MWTHRNAVSVPDTELCANRTRRNGRYNRRWFAGCFENAVLVPHILRRVVCFDLFGGDVNASFSSISQVQRKGPSSFWRGFFAWLYILNLIKFLILWKFHWEDEPAKCCICLMLDELCIGSTRFISGVEHSAPVFKKHNVLFFLNSPSTTNNFKSPINFLDWFYVLNLINFGISRISG